MNLSRYNKLLMFYTSLLLSCSPIFDGGPKLYIQQHQWEKAKQLLLKDIKANPLCDECFYLLGYTEMRLNNPTLMNKYFDSSLAISKRFEDKMLKVKEFSWAIYFSKGLRFYFLNDNLKSDSLFHLAKEVDSTNSEKYRNILETDKSNTQKQIDYFSREKIIENEYDLNKFYVYHTYGIGNYTTHIIEVDSTWELYLKSETKNIGINVYNVTSSKTDKVSSRNGNEGYKIFDKGDYKINLTTNDSWDLFIFVDK